jgi:uncharacterized FAD-dependent dehydrogenase
MLRISGVKVPVREGEEGLIKKLSSLLRCQEEAYSMQIKRKSLDARDKEDKRFVYTVDVSMAKEKKVVNPSVA